MFWSFSWICQLIKYFWLIRVDNLQKKGTAYKSTTSEQVTDWTQKHEKAEKFLYGATIFVFDMKK